MVVINNRIHDKMFRGKRVSMSRSVGVRLFILGLTMVASAATVKWQSSTQQERWVDKGTIETTNWDNDNSRYISVDEKTMYQTFEGHGGCFNELGWKVLMKLSQSDRDSVLKMLFDSTGCNFSICRVPIGANDYTIKPYSLNENANDYAMEKFSIEHDQEYLLPYIKAAMKVRPDLKVWGSPWTVPTWMKDSKQYNNGSMLDNDQMYGALALYFAKAVKAYQAEGLDYFAVAPANEPNWNVSMGYPVTGWSAGQLLKFIKNYMGPTFKKEDVNADIFLGTLMIDQDVNGNKQVTATVFADSTAYSYCAGAGFQYGMSDVKTKYSDRRFMETETPCGTVGRFNDAAGFWNYAMDNDKAMRDFIVNGGVSVYEQWNMVLDTSGANIADWRQYAPIMVDTVAKKVTYTPQFYQVRHYGYVKPYAKMIHTTGNTDLGVIAFRNPNGENVLIVTNRGNETTIAISFNGQKIKPTLPAGSFNSFRIAGTPLPPRSPFEKMEAENFDEQSGVLIRDCSDGGKGVTHLENNDWLIYRNVDFGDGAKGFEARVAGIGGGTIEVRIDSATGPVAGTCTVEASSPWSTVTCVLNGVSGNHWLYLKFKGSATGKLLDLNWFRFEQGTSVAQRLQNRTIAAGGSRIFMYNGISRSGSTVNRYGGPGAVVYNLKGKVISSGHNGTPVNGKNIGGLRKGVYIIRK